jgi:hypothetical protein
MLRGIRFCAVSMSLVAMLPACAPTADRWSKEGSTVEARDSSFASCRSTANARVASAPPASTYQPVPAAGGVIGILVGALVLTVVQGAAKGVAANASIDSCMREAGFSKPQPAVATDGDRKDAGATDVNAGGRRTDTREIVKTSTVPGAGLQSGPVGESAPANLNTGESPKPRPDCAEAAISPGPRTSLLANQPPPVSCPPKAGRAP